MKTTYSIGYLNDVMLRFIERRASTVPRDKCQARIECIEDTLTNIDVMCARLHLQAQPYEQLYLSKIGGYEMRGNA